MIPRLAVGLFVAMLLPAPAGTIDDPPAPGLDLPRVEAGEPILRFNGKDLDGFYTYLRYHKYDDPDRVFSVRDGSIRISGGEAGGLVTKAAYGDYHLVAEWKWGGRTHYPRRWMARNSGIMVHGSGADGSALDFCLPSIECQIIEGGTGDLIVVPSKGADSPTLSSEVRREADGQAYFRPGGERVTLSRGRFNWWGRDPGWNDLLWFRGRRDVERPFGEWNRMEVVCRGDRITCILNGRVVNAADRSSRTSGKILFQSEGAEIFFRKVEVRPLAKSDESPRSPRHPLALGLPAR